VCDKSECYEGEGYDQDSMNALSYDYFDECCYGHYENDQLLDFVNGDKSSGFGMTNREVITSTDPSNKDYAMTYIYDKFEWDHCTENFNSLFDSQRTQTYGSRMWNAMGETLHTGGWRRLFGLMSAEKK